MKKENKNFLYNVVYQLFSFIVPLIITPYVSRTLGADNLGISAFTYSIVNYFMLGTLLGINNYGSRSIAKISVENDKDKLSYKFCSIYYLQLSIGIIMLITYNIITMLIFQQYRIFFLIDNIYLISAIIDINWFFFGMEKFKITVSRNIIIKLISLIFILLFVKSNNDLIIYIVISASSILISQMYMWIHLRKHIKFKKVKIKDILDNLKPCLVLFIPIVAYSIYRVMDKTMIGFISGTESLGYYHNGELIINIPLGIISALGTVMMPNISKVIDKELIKNKIMDSFKLIIFMTIPMFFGIIAVGKDFSIVFFGEEFQASGTIMKYLAITIIFAAIANVIRTNYLIPQKKDKIYVISTIGGAVSNFLINIILIPKFSYVGACIGTIFAEFSVMFYQIIKTRNNINYKNVLLMAVKFLLKGIIMFIAICIVGIFINNILYRVIIQVTIGIICYSILNYKYILFEFFNFKKKNNVADNI